MTSGAATEPAAGTGLYSKDSRPWVKGISDDRSVLPARSGDDRRGVRPCRVHVVRMGAGGPAPSSRLPNHSRRTLGGRPGPGGAEHLPGHRQLVRTERDRHGHDRSEERRVGKESRYARAKLYKESKHTKAGSQPKNQQAKDIS